MDTETRWILEKLAARDISVQSADRILRALALLCKDEKHRATDILVAAERETSAEISQTIQRNTPTAAELSLLENAGTSPQEIEEYAKETQKPVMGSDERPGTQWQKGARNTEEISSGAVDVENELSQENEVQSKTGAWETCPPIENERETVSTEMGEDQETEESALEALAGSEITNKSPLLGNDGVGIIEDILNGTELMLEKAGNVIIQGWDQPHIRAEGKVDSSTVLRMGRSLKIEREDDFALYIPASVKEINVASGSGSIDIKNYPNNIVIDSDTGDINIRDVGGAIVINNIESDITLENCHGTISLESKLGNVVVRKSPTIQTVGLELLEDDIENILEVTGIDIESDSGDITLTDIGSEMDVKTNIGDITLERCRGHHVSVESSGGSIILKNMADSMNLKNENGSVEVDSFSGAVSIEAKDTRILLRNSSDAEIHVKSDGGDINIEDCYADICIDSGSGNVSVSGGNLSFDEIGRVELKMKSGDAYLHGRTFADVRVVIEEGNAEVNMEKLTPGGSGRISVYRGDITIGILPGFGCELIARGPRNKMSIELPVEVIEKDNNCLRAMLNSGGPRMEVIAPNGEIRLYALESPHT